MRKIIGVLWLLMVLLQSTIALAAKPNVLFIAVDDLNDWVGFLEGHPNAKTPNLDKLASRGVAFTNAYTVSPICGPSRASVLTGMRPETTGVYHNKGMYKDYVPDAVALPKFLKDNGYYVMGAGKINHAMGMVAPENYHEYGPDAGAIGGPFTWQELSLTPGKKVRRKDILGKTLTEKSGIIKDVYPNKIIKRGTLAATLPLNGIDNTLDRPFNGYNTFDWGPVGVADDEMPDGKIAQWATEKLTENYTKPFFLGIGFYRPHQPFYVPKKYFDAFADEVISLPRVQRNDLSDLSETARQYAHYPWSGSFSRVQKHNAWQAGVLAYLAAIHFADAQVGRVLDALENSTYKDNTLIVLWSDHGWELGEKEHWGKHSPWEGSTRVPFIIVPPKSAKLQQGPQTSFASLLDIYPTIADYANLAIPENLEGKSLKAVVAGQQEKVRDYNISTLGRASYALRIEHWKFIRYYDGSEELYDLSKDAHEWHNLAKVSAYQSQLANYRKLLPIDKRFKQLIRYKNFKAIITAQDEFQLYNMLDAKNGIGEQDEVAHQYPDMALKIQKMLKDKKLTSRHVDLSSQPEI
jgi:arylsulfatase A-like enzyme